MTSGEEGGAAADVLSTGPRAAAYLALLSVTALGTISSTIMSAPINVITAEVGTTGRGIVLAVSAFTVAMVMTAPASGWLADRLGPRRYLFVSLVLMIVGQAAAGFSTNLTMLVAARVVQGIACSGIPACVQFLLARHWPTRRRQSMAAWASAIGVGQAIGPPTGGAVAQLLSWRWVFGAAALVVLAVLFVLARTLPQDEAAPGAALMDTRALIGLTVGAGLLALGLTGVGQGHVAPAAALTVVSLVVLATVLRPGRRPSVLGDVGRDPRYAITTLSAATAMAAMGITLVSVPVYLGTVLRLGPGSIGASTVALAVGMVTWAPVAGRIALRIGTTRTLAAGLVLIMCTTTALGIAESRGDDTSILPVVLVLLFCIGCAIATVQSMAAVAMLDVAGASGSAMGVHNVGRFSGLCAGYAWLALTIPLGQAVIIHSGSAVLALTAVVALGIAHRSTGVRDRRPAGWGRPAQTSR